MRVRGCADDGEHAEWFDVTQGLRQGYVPSSLLFNMLFAAAIRVDLVRFSDDESMSYDLVHLEKDGVDGNEEPTMCIRREVWGVRYADDEGVVSNVGGGTC